MDLRTDACPIARTLGVVGTRSAMLIIREAFYGTTRFDDFAARIGFSVAITATRLRELTAAGLLERGPSDDADRRSRHGYRLTGAGLDLAPVILGLHRWGTRHLPVEAGDATRMIHADCGSDVEVTISCAAGHHVMPDGLDPVPTAPPTAAGRPTGRPAARIRCR